MLDREYQGFAAGAEPTFPYWQREAAYTIARRVPPRNLPQGARSALMDAAAATLLRDLMNPSTYAWAIRPWEIALAEGESQDARPAGDFPNWHLTPPTSPVEAELGPDERAQQEFERGIEFLRFLYAVDQGRHPTHPCSANRVTGKPCKGRAYAGNPPLCAYHWAASRSSAPPGAIDPGWELLRPGATPSSIPPRRPDSDEPALQPCSAYRTDGKPCRGESSGGDPPLCRYHHQLLKQGKLGDALKPPRICTAVRPGGSRCSGLAGTRTPQLCARHFELQFEGRTGPFCRATLPDGGPCPGEVGYGYFLIRRTETSRGTTDIHYHGQLCRKHNDIEGQWMALEVERLSKRTRCRQCGSRFAYDPTNAKPETCTPLCRRNLEFARSRDKRK